MTRDELIIYLHRIGSAAYTQAYEEKVMAHDDEQRRVVQRLEKELADARKIIDSLHPPMKFERS